MKIIFSVLIIGFTFLQATILTIPFSLGLFVLFYVFRNSFLLLFIAFISGLILDTMLLNTHGTSSVFLLLFLGFIFLYQRKFEIKTIQFVFFATFIGSTAFLFLFGYHYILEQATIVSFISVFLFIFMSKLSSKNLNTNT